MKKIILIKPVKNKRNGQLNCSLPKKFFSSNDLNGFTDGKKLKIKEWSVE